MDNAVKEIRELFAEKAAEDAPVQVDIEDPIEEVVEAIQEDPAEVIEPEVEAQAGEDSETPDTPYTVASLAEAIDVDAEFLYDVEIGMPDGAESIKLGALKDQYQSVISENAALKSKMDGMSSEMDNFNDQTAMGQGVSQEMIQAFAAKDNIKAQFEQTDWPAIEAEDAGQAALLRQKFQEAWNNADNQINQAQNNMAQYKNENLNRAATKMFELIPEWKDKDKRKADQAKIRNLMVANGYNDKVINGIQDPMAMVMLKRLAYLEEMYAGGKEAVKQVRAAPKVLPGGGRRAVKKVTLAEKVKDGKGKVRGASAGGRRQAELDAVKALFGKQA